MYSTYEIENQLTDYYAPLLEPYFGNIKRCYGKEDQFQGIDLITDKFGKVDLKYDFYDGEYLALEVFNERQVVENSYLVRKPIDHVGYYRQGIDCIYMIPYKILRIVALAAAVKPECLYKINSTHTLWLPIPLEEFKPFTTDIIQLPHKPDIEIKHDLKAEEMYLEALDKNPFLNYIFDYLKLCNKYK